MPRKNARPAAKKSHMKLENKMLEEKSSRAGIIGHHGPEDHRMLAATLMLNGMQTEVMNLQRQHLSSKPNT